MNDNKQLPPSAEPAARLVGESPAFLRATQQVGKIAATDHTVLILGPSGAGKEVIAQRLHQLGRRATLPFIDLNCAAIPAQLIETELFGHARGAYTGAVGSRIGHFETVGAGTLFLDEIGELPLALQPVLLRVLETRRFRPVGSNTVRCFQGRVIAATHRNLKELVKQGLFREDLYYRLAVFEIELPGLDQRPEDIVPLAEHFAAQQARPLTFTSDAKAMLTSHCWPGHARQLRSLIERLSVLADCALISSAILRLFLMEASPSTQRLPHAEIADALMCLPGKDKLASAECLLIERAMQLSGGNKSTAAQVLGVGRKVIERRLKVHEQRLISLPNILTRAQALILNSQFQAAIVELQPALSGYERQSATPLILRQLFEGYRLLGVCHRSIQGWLSPCARSSDEIALEIGTGICEPEDLLALQFGVWGCQLMALDLRSARSTAQEMLRRAQTNNIQDMLDEAHIALANTWYWLGDFEQCLSSLLGSGLTAEVRHHRIGQQGLDFTGLALTLEGLAAFHSGAFRCARNALERLTKLCAEHHSAFSAVVILQGVTWLSCLFEEAKTFGYFAQELLDMSYQNGFIFYQGIGQVFHGWYLAQENFVEAGLATIIDGYEQQILRHGGHLFYSFQVWKRAKLLLRVGRPEESLKLITQALERVNRTQERAYLCDLLTVRAQSLLALGESEDAEHSLRSSLSIAFAIGSVSARITAAVDLATLLIDKGRRVKALQMLDHALEGIALDGAPPIVSRAHVILDSLRPA